MDDNPFQSPTTCGANSDAQVTPVTRLFERQFIGAICVNAGVAIFAELILDGGWIARHYAPIAIALLVMTILLFVRRKRAGEIWTVGDRFFLYAGPPLGLVTAMVIATLRS